ncbi:VWA domain-containing protein [bacterium]|nr:MAG: VWA domain-containing protein [bacterium]
MAKLLSLAALRATVAIAARDTGVTFVPARTWSGDPVARIVTYPERALSVWLRDENPLIDIGPPSRGIAAQRRLASLFTRLGSLLAETAPPRLTREAVRASGVFTPEEIVRLFWHAEHGVAEAALRARSPHALKLGYYPPFGEGWRSYAVDGDLAIRLYGTLANPIGPHVDAAFLALVSPLQVATTRVDRWAILREILPLLAHWLPPVQNNPAIIPVPSLPSAPSEDADGTEHDTPATTPTASSPVDGASDEQSDPGKESELHHDSTEGGAGSIDPIVGTTVPSEELRYDDDIAANLELERQLLQPTIAAFTQAVSRILGVSRSIRVRRRNQRRGRIDPTRLTRAVAHGSDDCFVRSQYKPRGTRLSLCFLVDDSGSMAAPSEASFNPGIDFAHPDLREIDAIRLLALALSTVAFATDGRCAITTINHPTVTPWTPKTTGKALARFIPDGGSEPDASLGAALARLHELPAPRIVVFLTDGYVMASDSIAAGVPLIPVVPASFRHEILYGHPVVRLDKNFVESFSKRIQALVNSACVGNGARSIA